MGTVPQELQDGGEFVDQMPVYEGQEEATVPAGDTRGDEDGHEGVREGCGGEGAEIRFGGHITGEAGSEEGVGEPVCDHQRFGEVGKALLRRGAAEEREEVVLPPDGELEDGDHERGGAGGVHEKEFGGVPVG